MICVRTMKSISSSDFVRAFSEDTRGRYGRGDLARTAVMGCTIRNTGYLSRTRMSSDATAETSSSVCEVNRGQTLIIAVRAIVSDSPVVSA